MTPSDPAPFHKLAKDAGNRLATYITNFASGVVAVLFLAAMQESAARLTPWQRGWLLAALLLAAVTVVLRLAELHVDARRFFEVAVQTGRSAERQDWRENERMKALRLRLIFGSYWTFAAAVGCTVGLLIARLA